MVEGIRVVGLILIVFSAIGLTIWAIVAVHFLDKYTRGR